jgi:hypothetical protein
MRPSKGEKAESLKLPAVKTRLGTMLVGLGFSLPWLLAAPALIFRFGL